MWCLEEISPDQLCEWEQSQLIFLGLYFLICKKKGLDSVIAKVTSSFVNSVLLKYTWILKEEHLLGFRTKEPRLYLCFTCHYILTCCSNESEFVLQ